MMEYNIIREGVYKSILNYCHKDDILNEKGYEDFIIDSDIHLKIRGIEINYKSDVWNFKQNAKDGKDKTNYIFNFDTKKYRFNSIYKTILKEYILWVVEIYGIHSGSNKNRYCIIKRFVHYLQSNNISIDEIDIDCIKMFLEDNNNTYNTIVKNKRIIKEFINHISITYSIKYSSELYIYLELENREIMQSEIERNKLQMLPDDFVKEYRRLLLKSISNKKLDKNSRLRRGILFVLSNTGNRTCEICTLEKEEIISNGKGYLINYKNIKASRRIDGVPITKGMPINNDTYKVIDDAIKRENPYKYVFENPTNRKYFSVQSVNRENIIFCIENAEKLGLLDCPNKDDFRGCLTRCYKTSKDIVNRIIKKLGDSHHYISYPWTEQFRNYASTTLMDMGISKDTVSSMFWESPEMVQSHYRETPNSIRNEFESMKRKGQVLPDGSLNFEFTVSQCAFINKIHDILEDSLNKGYSNPDIQNILLKEFKKALKEENK